MTTDTASPKTAECQQSLIGGKWVAGEDELAVIDPATEETISFVSIATPAQARAALEAARSAQRLWARRTSMARGDLLREWAKLIRRDREDLAVLICREQGKPLELARMEVDVAAMWLEYNAGFDRRIEGEILPADHPDEQMLILRAPLGVVVCLVPWNFPLAIAARKIAPAMITGNTVVVKPHEDTPLSMIAAARLAIEAGIPDGVLNVIVGPGPTTGCALIDSPIPNMISFTGQASTGKIIRGIANQYLTPVTLELGGKQPFIVMDDADIDHAVDALTFSRFINCGQACTASERAYIHENIWDTFLERLVTKTKALKVGPPSESGVFVGPKVSLKELEKVDRMVQQAVADGANVLLGGHRLTEKPFNKGFWYAPTILTDVTQDSAIMHDEIFGPVLPLASFRSFKDVIELANDSEYGLSVCLFTRDVSRIMTAMRELECGEIYINRPIGESIHGYHNGWKQSGMGGDDGKHGLEHFMRKKVVYLRQPRPNTVDV